MFSVATGMVSRAEFLSRLEPYELVRTNKGVDYYNVPCAFDIETSSFYIDGQKYACMYIWMFGINNLVTYGRTWEEFQSFISVLSTVLDLSQDRKLCVYVHNLAYEFQWIRKIFEWNEVFLLDDRKPVYCQVDGLEFRCSLKLAGGKSLENVGKDLQKYKVEKQVGFLDYSLIRTPLTYLTKKELLYCENDIRVLLSYIQEKIENEGDITKIPLTNTGYVRNYCRKACYKKWRKYRQLMDSLTITPYEYSQLKLAFQGGFTHANAKYVMKVLSNVGSHDLTSSYPTVMVLERFPMSRAKLIDYEISEKEFRELLKTKCCMFDLELENVIPLRWQDNPISKSKCWELRNYIENNGRVVMAEHLKTTCTEQDFFIYEQFYDWGEYHISNLRVYEKQYLPRNFVKSILKLYSDKTSLKGVEGEEVNYMISKNMINAAYGMMVTDINRTEYKYDSGSFLTMPADLEKNMDRYNNNKRRFLYYPWGVWVTAYARANLFSAIIEAGDDYVYSDTDSVKLLNPERHVEYFKKYGEEILRKIEMAAQYHNIDVEMFSPKNPKGKSITIGLWDDEGIYNHFKTLGAKRYLIEKNGEYQLTVAGVNKKKACEYLVSTGDPFGSFNDGLVVPVDYTKRNILTYIDTETEGDIVDYTGVPYHFHELSSVHMEGTEYSLSMSDVFLKYLKEVKDFSE